MAESEPELRRTTQQAAKDNNTETMTGWCIFENNGGETKGLNDAGIANFREGKSLERETIQNTNDQWRSDCRDAGKPARITFELKDIRKRNIPGIDRFREIYMACKESTPRGTHDRVFDRGIEILDGLKIPVLRIGDVNTNGLPGSDTEKESPWYRLIRGQGYSQIEGSGGGTYGIGQRAPFAFTDLRLVFYSTMLQDGTARMMGKFILSTFEERGVEYREVGYWGNLVGDGPVSAVEGGEIPEIFRREEPGLDLYIIGYDKDQHSSRVIKETAVIHFFAAILNGQLQVEVAEGRYRELISSQNIDDVVKRLIDHREKKRGWDSRWAERDLKATKFYLRALQEPIEFVEEIDGLGRVKLDVFKAEGAPNRVSFMRSPRMLIYEDSFGMPYEYVGVVLCDNPEGNRYLGRLEDPGHQKWNSDFAQGFSTDEKQEAKRRLRGLRDFVRDSLMTLVVDDEIESEDIPDLADYLPAEDDDPDYHGRTEDLVPALREEEPPVKKRNQASRAKQGSSPYGSGSDGTSGAGGSNETKGGDQSGHGEGDGSAAGPASGGTGAEVPVDWSHIRFRSYRNRGSLRKYTVILESDEAVKGDLALRALGADGRVYDAELNAARDRRTGTDLLSNGRIQNISLPAGSKVILDVESSLDIPLTFEIG